MRLYRASWRVLLYLGVTVVLLITLIDVSRVSIGSMWDTTTHTLRDGWTLSVNGEVRYRNLSLPTVLGDTDLDGQHVVLSRVIEKPHDQTNSIMFRTSQKIVQVFLDGEQLYSYDGNLAERRVQVLGYMNHVVWLPADSDGAKLEIEMTANSSRSAGTFYPVYIGTRTSQLVALMRYDGISFVFGTLILLTSLTVFLLSIGLFRKLAIHRSAQAFAGIELCAGLWMVGGSMSTQLFIHNQLILLTFGVFAMYMLPVFITRFVQHTYNIPGSRVLNRVVLLFPLWFMIATVLQYVGVSNYHTWFTPTAIVLLIYLLVVVTLSVKAYRRGDRTVGQFLVAFVCLLVSIIGELILLLMPVHTLFNALFLNLGIMAFGFVLLRQVLVQVMRFIELRGKEKYLLSQVDLDGLTGVANRRAFEDRMDQLRSRDFSDPIALMVFDVNNLKELNDREGHSVGDEFLRAIARQLMEKFAGVGTVYRIGGDEFAMICDPCDSSLFTQAQNTLLSGDFVDGIDTKIASIAHGEALWRDANDYVSVDALFDAADSRMYARKVEMKGGLAR